MRHLSGHAPGSDVPVTRRSEAQANRGLSQSVKEVASSEGKVAAVAVLLKAGKANTTIARLLGHMPKAEGEEKVARLEANPLSD